jgi:hypothetical protein
MFWFSESVILTLTLYFLPTIIAAARGHQSWLAIAALNSLLGWTGICWIISLVWSLTGVRVEYGGGGRYYRPRDYY